MKPEHDGEYNEAHKPTNMPLPDAAASTPPSRPIGLGPFPAEKTFACGCVMRMEEPDVRTRTVRVVIDYAHCAARHASLA